MAAKYQYQQYPTPSTHKMHYDDQIAPTPTSYTSNEKFQPPQPEFEQHAFHQQAMREQQAAAAYWHNTSPTIYGQYPPMYGPMPGYPPQQSKSASGQRKCCGFKRKSVIVAVVACVGVILIALAVGLPFAMSWTTHSF
jgi:hypothetical protein